MKNLILIGFMGVGKTTVGKLFSREKGRKFVDTDERIVREQKKSIPELFDERGEGYFRDLETELLKEFQTKRNAVISCGGGTALRECNVTEMKKNGRIVLLTASPELIYDRVKDIDNRPVLFGRKTVEGISGLMEQRREKYEAAADIVIRTDNKSVSVICRELMQSLTEMDE